jgi:hypothetical protein
MSKSFPKLELKLHQPKKNYLTWYYYVDPYMASTMVKLGHTKNKLG